ncbi:MAG: hypothetical protein PHX27_03545 [Candidatus ainarchaeum sp.]|nr:hypothetical protein [Candidatus ainarchaeum sp.]
MVVKKNFNLRRVVAGKVLNIKRKKINQKYYNLTVSEVKRLKQIEALKKKSKKVNWDIVREEISIREKKIPTIRAELKKLGSYEKMLLIQLNKKNSVANLNILKNQLTLTRSEIKDGRKNLRELESLASKERMNAIKKAEKIAGAKK